MKGRRAMIAVKYSSRLALFCSGLESAGEVLREEMALREICEAGVELQLNFCGQVAVPGVYRLLRKVVESELLPYNAWRLTDFSLAIEGGKVMICHKDSQPSSTLGLDLVTPVAVVRSMKSSNRIQASDSVSCDPV